VSDVQTELARLQLAKLREEQELEAWEADQARRIAERDEHRARHDDRRPDDDEARPVYVEIDDDPERDFEKLSDHVRERAHAELSVDESDEARRLTGSTPGSTKYEEAFRKRAFEKLSRETGIPVSELMKT
jgi:hypothetical protein